MPIIVGIAGGTGSGKTSFAQKLLERLAPDQCTILAQDAYYKDGSNLGPEAQAAFNYDHPETFGPCLEGVDRMFIVPPLLSPRQHEQIIAFIKFAETTGVKHIVNLSQMGSDEIKDLPLRKGEIYIEGCGIPYTH